MVILEMPLWWKEEFSASYSQHAEMEPIVMQAVDAIKKHRFEKFILGNIIIMKERI